MSVQGVVNGPATRMTRSKRSAHPGEGEGEDNAMSDAPQHVSKHAKQAPAASAAAALAPVQPLGTRNVLRNISNAQPEAANGKHAAHVPAKKAAAAPIPSRHAPAALVEEIVDDASEHSDKVLTRAQRAAVATDKSRNGVAQGPSLKKAATRAAGHSSSSVTSTRSTTSSRVAANGHAAAAVSAVPEDEDEDMGAEREDSQQPGLKRRLRSHAASVQPAHEAEEEEEDEDYDESTHDHVRHIADEPIAMNEEDADEHAQLDEIELLRNKPVPHAHHKHATAHLHVAPTAAAAAASIAEHAPIAPAAVVPAAATASSASAAAAPAAPVALADQASWLQCRDDPCQEYADSIYQHLRATELLNFPDPAYMETVQGDLTHAMRSILVDWLVEVALEYKLGSQSLFLGVAFLDRFLSRQAIDRSRLQLVGVSALLLAAKYWEIWPPAIEEFVYISDNTYTKQEVLHMESVLLQTLQFKLTAPTSWEFSRRFCKAAHADRTTECLVDYLLELMLQEAASLSFRPSVVAASALFLALYTRHLPPWSERLETQTGIRVEELQACVRTLHALYVKTCIGQHTLRAVKDKYAQEHMCKVSLIQPRNM